MYSAAASSSSAGIGSSFVEWLLEEDILTTVDGDEPIPADELDAAALYTNELLP